MRDVAITGAGRGIGRAIAERFLRDGWRVWALVRQESALAPLRQLGEVRFVPFDATHPEAVRAAAAQLEKALGGAVQVLVNNAGIALSAPLARTSLEDFARVQAVNVTAPFLLCQALVPAMVKAGAGRIVNIASTAGRKGFKYSAAYCASKHALLGLTRSLAAELAAKGVTVNSVSPGWTDTDMFTASIERLEAATGRTREAARAALEQLNPTGHAVRPEQVAALVHFLAAAPEAVAITGADYLIDGGETV